MSSRLKRFSTMWVISICVIALGMTAAAQADRNLEPGIALAGSLTSEELIQVYTFAGVTEQEVTLVVASEDVADLDVVLVDEQGEPVSLAAPADANEGQATLSGVLPTDGTYYVTVFSSDLPTAGIDFEITLETDAAVVADPVATFTPPGQLLTATGMQVRLGWNTNANLDLEVRDPVGGSLFWERPQVNSGGVFGVNANTDCANLNTTSPFEEASWPTGVIPTGSYELIVYYQQQDACRTTGTANVTLNVTVDGTAATAIQGAIQPGQIFLASFDVANDGTITVRPGGIKVDPPTATGIDVSEPLAVTVGTEVTGVLTNGQVYQAYSFAATTGQSVSLDMSATSGNLDTLLLLLDPNGNVVAINDDRETGNTNSLIPNVPLLLQGTYTIIATRYGQSIGGTQGNYVLSLTNPQAVLPVGDGAATAVASNLPLLPAGSVQVSLQWSSNADIQLLVREPSGDSIYDDRTTSNSGGILAANGNVNCVPAASGTPISYIYWPEGRLPSPGAYEIQVWYQNNCNDTRPVTFNLTVTAGGNLIAQRSETIRVGEQYVISYEIGLDGQITGGEGGFFGTVQRPDVTAVNFQGQVDDAQALIANQSVTGSIRLDRRFDVYTFEGLANQEIQIVMEQLNGTLDPVLFMVDPSGIQVAQNDDATPETRNSDVSYTLPADGEYIIIATHYGGRFGVTQGDYRLTLRLN
jgi:uncharacterized protein YfaP (DUF2135 family)